MRNNRQYILNENLIASSVTLGAIYSVLTGMLFLGAYSVLKEEWILALFQSFAAIWGLIQVIKCVKLVRDAYRENIKLRESN